ncbi:MAG: hypothetical protein ACJZ4J_03650 [Candidatus Poseidoniales archaeon]
MEDDPVIDTNGFFLSIIVSVALLMVLPNTIGFHLTEPLMRDQSIFIGSRYTITVDALNTIADDDSISVIAIGSSMTFKGIDGECIGNGIDDDVRVYNLAQPASKPYTDMQHIPRILLSNPEIVMIEISPDILSTPTSSSSIEYLQLRYTLDTMYQDGRDLGKWVEIVPSEYRQWIATNEFERSQFRQEYVPSAIEEHLQRMILEENSGRAEGLFGWVPDSNHDDWVPYLQTPIFAPDTYGLEGMSDVELDEYFITKLQTSPWASPPSTGTLSHLALNYQITSLIEGGIDVVIITPAYHPEHLKFLEEGQWDGFNETISAYSQYDGVTIFDQIWVENTWTHEDFYDRNHLDDDGREKYCEQLIPTISEILHR